MSPIIYVHSIHIDSYYKHDENLNQRYLDLVDTVSADNPTIW